MKAPRSVYVNEDRKNNKGDWLRSWNGEINGEKVQIHSRAGRSWRGIQNRCKPGGHIQGKRPTYIGCVNRFESFQEFAEWCQSDAGYQLRIETGEIMHLDKDLIIPGNKVYSKDTCCFVPANINTLLLFPSSRKHEYLPVGCSISNRSKYFYSYINGADKKTVFLGYFSDKMEAHAKWQTEKVKIIRDRAGSMHPSLWKVKEYVLKIADRIESDLLNNVESKF